MTARAAPLGTFAVHVDGERARALATALGRGTAEDGVPLTYPLTWLAEPGVRAAVLVAGRIDPARVLPVHIEQRLEQTEPLRAGAAYRLTLALEGPDARGILRVTGTWANEAGHPGGTMVAGLLLVPLNDGGKA